MLSSTWCQEHLIVCEILHLVGNKVLLNIAHLMHFHPRNVGTWHHIMLKWSIWYKMWFIWWVLSVICQMDLSTKPFPTSMNMTIFSGLDIQFAGICLEFVESPKRELTSTETPCASDWNFSFWLGNHVLKLLSCWHETTPNTSLMNNYLTTKNIIYFVLAEYLARTHKKWWDAW